MVLRTYFAARLQQALRDGDGACLFVDGDAAKAVDTVAVCKTPLVTESMVVQFGAQFVGLSATIGEAHLHIGKLVVFLADVKARRKVNHAIPVFRCRRRRVGVVVQRIDADTVPAVTGNFRTVRVFDEDVSMIDGTCDLVVFCCQRETGTGLPFRDGDCLRPAFDKGTAIVTAAAHGDADVVIGCVAQLYFESDLVAFADHGIITYQHHLWRTVGAIDAAIDFVVLRAAPTRIFAHFSALQVVWREVESRRLAGGNAVRLG